MASAVCRSGIAFVKCLNITHEQCLTDADRFAQVCTSKMPKPNGADESGQWGMALGMCIEDSLVNHYQKQSSNTSECEKSQGGERRRQFKSQTKFKW